MEQEREVRAGRVPDGVAQAVHAVLVLVARLLLKFGATAQDFHCLGRKAFVDAARMKVNETGGKPTVSRVALVSGLPRQATSELMGESVIKVDTPIPAISRVIERWSQHSPWRDESGPRELPTTGKWSFETLCSECGISGYKVRTLLDHLKGEGNVVVGEDERISLVKTWNVPAGFIDMSIAGLQNVERHLRTVIWNCTREKGRLVEHTMGTFNLPGSRRGVARRDVTDSAVRALREAEKRLGELESTAKYGEFGIGVYLFETRPEGQDKEE